MKSPSPKEQKKIADIFQQGQRAIQLGLFSQAEKHFLNILELRSDIAEAQAALAYIYTTTKKHMVAATYLRSLLNVNPNHAQTHQNLANCLYEQELYKEAITHYKTAIKIDSRLVESHIHCGIAYRMINNHEAAISILHQVLNLDKENARAFYILGMVYDDIKDHSRALECLESAISLAPDIAEFRLSFASMLEKAQLDPEAGLEYHKACEIDPNYLDSFTLYAEYLLKGYRYDEALECLIHATSIGPKNLDIIDQLGRSYSGMNDTDAAVKQYNRALAKDPKRLSSLLGLAQVYKEAGDSDKGIETCDRVIKLDETQPDGYIAKSFITKANPGDALTKHLLESLSLLGIDDQQRALTYFALGKIYDDVKDYKKAFKAYANANAINNKSLNYNKNASEKYTSKLIDLFDSHLFEDKKLLGVKNDLPVIIVGMPRSGTTLIEQIISSHPEVIAAGEVTFWGKSPTAMPLRLNSKTPYPDCISKLSVGQAESVAQIYKTTLQKIAGLGTNPKYITDKMPHNFLNIGLITLLFPNAKIIHVKRDPLDTCLSIFFQNFHSWHAYASDLGNLAHQYKQYERIMRHWHKVLPGRILDINYEDLTAKPEFWSKKLIDHLNLDWTDACIAPHKLERNVKTASHWQVRQPIYKTSVRRWKNYEAYLTPLINAMKN